MSQLFNLKYDGIKAGTEENQSSIIKGESSPRNVCFVTRSGCKTFFSYGYLVSGTYNPDDNRIILTFATHEVIIEGVNLEALFSDLMDHTPKQISAVDLRYNALGDKTSCMVNEIGIKEKDR